MRNTPPFSWPFICLILLGLCTLVVSSECLASQQSLLLQLKASLSFSSEDSKKLVNWNESSDCCSWEGVTCEEGRVTHLDLSYEGIHGGLDNSSVLFNLQHLKSLDLSFNLFNSTIPSRIGSLTNLSHLNLKQAGFVGSPTELSRLTSLVTLDLTFVSLPAALEIPNLSILIQNLSKREEIYLAGANISTPGNRWCQALSSSLPNLRVLHLSFCQVPGPLDQSLVELQSLSVIDLEGTNLSSPVPQSFAKFSNLILLNLCDCGLQGIFPSGIFQIPTLQIIDLSSNEFLMGTLPEFRKDNSLGELSLSHTKFGGTLPASLGNLWNLSTLDLSMCHFNGTLPSSMSNLTQMVDVDLSSNNFTGQVPSFTLSTKLASVNLFNNYLVGEFPLSLFELPSLEMISLSYNQFSGPIPEFKLISSSLLNTLDLSHNNLESTSIFKPCKINGTKHQQIFQGHSEYFILDLSFNNLRSFPDLKNLSKLSTLSLSNNQISGVIPKWIWEVGKESLVNLNLSRNFLIGMQQPFVFPEFLHILDLHNNQLQGNIPVLPQNLLHLDLSNNNFTSLPHNNFDNNSMINIFSLSNNSLTGDLTEHICNAKYVVVLDLSHNNLSGRIPSCLIETSDSRDVLNLRKNNFEGSIPNVFPRGCMLKALDLNGNLIEGEIPITLANCLELEVLDLGHNKLTGEFPFMLKFISTLHVLILRSNKFYGSIKCLNAEGSWRMLQIFDAAHNNFSGELPRRWLTKLKGMVVEKDNAHLEVLHLDAQGNIYWKGLPEPTGPSPYYEYKVKVTLKGFDMELPKILNIFTCIDLSRNNFRGQIPPELGELHALYILNLSHNALTGHIPSSFGNLQNLESLDLSWNKLSGTIPTQLQSLNFLQILNLSFNQLAGMIPTGSQIQTFSEDSFIGNKGLYGCPLKRNCSGKEAIGALIPNATKDGHSNYKRKIDWSLLSVEFGLLTGFGLVVSPLVFSRRWRMWYYERADDIIFKIFPLAVSRRWFLWTAM